MKKGGKEKKKDKSDNDDSGVVRGRKGASSAYVHPSIDIMVMPWTWMIMCMCLYVYSQAAQLLATGGGFGGFNGAEAVSSGPSPSSSSSSSSSSGSGSGSTSLRESYDVDDSEINFSMKKLQKRDAVTQLKALGELKSLFEKRDPSKLIDILPAWVSSSHKGDGGITIHCTARAE
jgi:hypothetical protein